MPQGRAPRWAASGDGHVARRQPHRSARSPANRSAASIRECRSLCARIARLLTIRYSLDQEIDRVARSVRQAEALGRGCQLALQKAQKGVTPKTWKDRLMSMVRRPSDRAKSFQTAIADRQAAACAGTRASLEYQALARARYLVNDEYQAEIALIERPRSGNSMSFLWARMIRRTSRC